MIRVFIANEEVAPKDIDGTKDLVTTITVEDSETFSEKRAVSGAITVFGRAWAIVKEQLIDPPDGRIREVPFRMLDTCTSPAKLVFEGVLDGSTVDWCEGVCSATVTAMERTTASKAADCFRSTLIFDNHNGFQQAVHPRMTYCDEIRPEWLHHVVLIAGLLLMVVVDSLTIVVRIITFIIDAINWILDAIDFLIPGDVIDPIDWDGDANTSNFQTWMELRNRLRDSLVGCGRQHPSPLLRAYIGNVCAKCGIGFSSSILNDPSSEYWNTVLWNAPVEKGTRNGATTYIYENRPIMSGETLMQKLAPVFTAKYGFRNVGGQTKLVFERKDNFPDDAVWVDPLQLRAEGLMEEDLCYTYSSEAPHAYTAVGFSEDGMDEPGNEARNHYKTTAEWNQPFNAVQKGERAVQFQFGMLRCRRDGVASDILDSYLWVPWFTNPILEHAHAMMLSRGIAQLPKLLIWHPGTDQVQRGYDRPGTFKPADECYNFPYWVTEYGTAPNTGYPSNAANLNVYGRFHAFENPKVLGQRGIDFKFTFNYTAEHLDTMNPHAKVPLPIGGGIFGRITSITINHTKRTILVAGKA